MKKIISMLLTLTMLLSSMAIIATAETETLSDPIYSILKSDGTVNGWGYNDGVKEDTVNKTTFKYVDFARTKEDQAVFGSGAGKAETTINMWVRLDDVTDSKKNVLFRTTLEQNTKRSWELFIRSGKLMQTYHSDGGVDGEADGTKVMNDIDISDYKDEYINVIITRKIDATANTMAFTTYFNGVAQTPHTLSVEANQITADNIANPEGTNNAKGFFIGGLCQDNSSHTRGIDGGIAVFDVYSSIIPSDYAATLYNNSKSTYELPVDPVEEYTNSNIYSLVKEDGDLASGWSNGLTQGTETNKAEKTFKYAKFDASSAEKPEQGSFIATSSTVVNKQNTTIDMWVKVNDISSANKQVLFQTVANQTSYKENRWELSVQSGVLKQTYIKESVTDETLYAPVSVSDDISLSGYQGKYVNVVVTRKVDSANKKMTFTTYFNGEKKSEKTIDVTDENVQYPDGNNANSWQCMWIGGVYNSTKQKFDGGMAKFDIYSSLVPSDTYVSTNYTANKDNYELYVSPETIFNNSKIYSIFKNGEMNIGDWHGVFSTEEYKNAKEENIKYINFETVPMKYDNSGKLTTTGEELAFAVPNVSIVNKNETTYDMWIKVDTISTSTKNIIFRTTSNQGDPNARRWELYVKDGKLKQTYATDSYCGGNSANEAISVCNDIDLANYAGKFVNVVVTRKADTANNKMIFQTYFNGVAQNPVTLEVSDEQLDAENITYPDGNGNAVNMWIGGYYGLTNHTLSFDGGIAVFDAYSSIIPESIAVANYTANKDTYAPSFINSKELKLNTVTPGLLTAAGKSHGWVTADATKDDEIITQAPTIKYVNNKLNKRITYVDFTPKINDLVGQLFCSANTAVNNPETTIDMWVKVDDILKNNTNSFRTIFYTTVNQSYPKTGENGTDDNERWHLFVQDGKLKQTYKGIQACAPIDITSFEEEFVHVVMTRDVDSENNTITFKTYFNGEAQTAVTLGTSDGITADNIANPDGVSDNNIQAFYVGSYYNEPCDNRFDGGIAKFDVYYSIISDALAASIHNDEKDSYTIKRGLSVSDISFYYIDSDENGDEIDSLNDLKNVTVGVQATLKNESKDSKNVFMALALYGENGKKLKKIAVLGDNDKTVNAGDQKPIEDELLLEDVTTAEGSVLKLLIWGDGDDFMIPIEISDGSTTELEWGSL